jgi:hypothetical protein
MAIYYGSTATGNLYRGTDQLGVIYYGSTEVNPGTIDSPILLTGLTSYYDAANELSNPGSGSKWNGLLNTYTLSNTTASFAQRFTSAPIEFDNLGGSIGGVVYNPISGSSGVYNNINFNPNWGDNRSTWSVLISCYIEDVDDDIIDGRKLGGIMFANPSANPLGFYTFWYVEPNGNWDLSVNSSPIAGGTNQIPLNQWHIVQLSVGGGTVSWNINNLYTGSAAGGQTLNNAFATMTGPGFVPVTPGDSWKGYTQVMAFYSSSLNQTQMAANFESLRSRYDI